MASIKTTWDGRTWYLYRDYYRSREGTLLHREKYQAHHGPLSLKFDVHHVDGDPTNNELANLEAISRREHMRRHPPRGFVAMSSDEHSARAKRVWQEAQPSERVCKNCGKTYLSTGMRAKFCKPACAAKHWRDTHPGYHKRFK